MKNSIGSTIVALLLLLALPAALVILANEISRLAHRLGLGAEMVRTTGVVVGISTWTESGDTYQSPVVSFTTPDGRQLTADMWCAPFGCFWKSDIGTPVRVVYPRDDARQWTVMADTLLGWVSDLFMLLIGSVLAAVGGAAASHLYSGLAHRFKAGTGGGS